MSTEVTTEMMNEAIALFINMDLKQDMDDPGFEWEWINAPKGLHWPSKTLPPFHTSWDWLMPVVEKIHGLAVAGDAINGITNETIFTFSIFAPLKDVHRAVYQFITWLNQQKTNQ